MTSGAEETNKGRKEGGISLAALRCFVAVVETGSLSRAAALLGVSQPTASITLAALERNCDTLLLHRHPRLAPTEAGRDMLIRARLVLSRMHEQECSITTFRDLGRGSRAIGFSTPAFAMPMIAAFMREHPGITIRWKLGNSAGLLEALAACEIEVAVVTLIDPPEGMASAKIAGQRLMGCVPIAKAPVSLSLQALATGPLIVREPGSMTRLMLERAFADHGLTPKICLDVASREAAKEEIAAGIGFGIVLDGEIGKDTRLAAVQIKAPPICGNFYAVALPESPDVPSVRAFFSGLDESP